jgi:hypothetical protein
MKPTPHSPCGEFSSAGKPLHTSQTPVSSSCGAPPPESHTSDTPAQKHSRLLNSAARKLHSSGERRPRTLKLPVWTRLRDRSPGLDGPRSRRTCRFDFHRGAARRRQGVLNASTSSSAEQGTRMVMRGTAMMSRGGGGGGQTGFFTMLHGHNWHVSAEAVWSSPGRVCTGLSRCGVRIWVGGGGGSRGDKTRSKTSLSTGYPPDGVGVAAGGWGVRTSSCSLLCSQLSRVSPMSFANRGRRPAICAWTA